MLHFRTLFGLGAVLALSSCTTELDSETQASALGDFRLDRVVVIANDPSMGALSRSISDEALELAVNEALEARFRRFEGDKTYSIGVKIQGYVLAAPGIPILLAPRSLLGISVNVYNDVPARLNVKTKNMTIFEDAGGDTVVGSGYTQSKEEQLAELAKNAAIEIELWLRENEGWFGGKAARPENTRPAQSAAPVVEPETDA